ncbi:MAG: hypothetical protein II510_06425, partial [Erysipelotrichales bacterium]|nr:hypothetical protein [Erysipelotrichales bacterium]
MRTSTNKTNPVGVVLIVLNVIAGIVLVLIMIGMFVKLKEAREYDPYVFDDIKANDVQLTGTPVTNSDREDYAIVPATAKD